MQITNHPTVLIYIILNHDFSHAHLTLVTVTFVMKIL